MRSAPISLSPPLSLACSRSFFFAFLSPFLSSLFFFRALSRSFSFSLVLSRSLSRFLLLAVALGLSFLLSLAFTRFPSRVRANCFLQRRLSVKPPPPSPSPAFSSLCIFLDAVASESAASISWVCSHVFAPVSACRAVCSVRFLSAWGRYVIVIWRWLGYCNMERYTHTHIYMYVKILSTHIYVSIYMYVFYLYTYIYVLVGILQCGRIGAKSRHVFAPLGSVVAGAQCAIHLVLQRWQ